MSDRKYAEYNREHNREYRRENYTGVYELTETEKLRMGLKKPKPLKGNIHIVIPVHYGTQGVQWQDRFVTPASLEWYRQQYPNMEVIDDGKHS